MENQLSIFIDEQTIKSRVACLTNIQRLEETVDLDEETRRYFDSLYKEILKSQVKVVYKCLHVLGQACLIFTEADPASPMKKTHEQAIEYYNFILTVAGVISDEVYLKYENQMTTGSPQNRAKAIAEMHAEVTEKLHSYLMNAIFMEEPSFDKKDLLALVAKKPQTSIR